MKYFKKLTFLIFCVLPLFLEGCKPVVIITAPANGDTFAVGETITFEGKATDQQHPNLADAAFVWTSDKDGEIGTGPSFESSDLSEGEHTITLTVTDPAGQSGKSSVTITVGNDGVPTTTTTILTTTTTLSGNSYSLNLSGVTTRQHMQDWDPNWISEFEDCYEFYEFQVDPGNGGQVGIWGGSGNPPSSGSWKDYSQYIAAGPPAGAPVRVRMKYEHRDDGAWASCSCKTDDPDLGRAHYEVANQAGAFRIYKFWGPYLPGDTWTTIASTTFSPKQGNIYWIYLTERRAGNSVNGTLNLSGELRDVNLNILATVSVTDDGNLDGITNPIGKPVIPSSNKRGFGTYCAPDGAGTKILEWIVEDAPI